MGQIITIKNRCEKELCRTLLRSSKVWVKTNRRKTLSSLRHSIQGICSNSCKRKPNWASKMLPISWIRNLLNNLESKTGFNYIRRSPTKVRLTFVGKTYLFTANRYPILFLKNQHNNSKEITRNCAPKNSIRPSRIRKWSRRSPYVILVVANSKHCKIRTTTARKNKSRCRSLCMISWLQNGARKRWTGCFQARRLVK